MIGKDINMLIITGTQINLSCKKVKKLTPKPTNMAVIEKKSAARPFINFLGNDSKKSFSA